MAEDCPACRSLGNNWRKRDYPPHTCDYPGKLPPEDDTRCPKCNALQDADEIEAGECFWCNGLKYKTKRYLKHGK